MSGTTDETDDEIFGFLNETAFRLRCCLHNELDVKQK